MTNPIRQAECQPGAASSLGIQTDCLLRRGVHASHVADIPGRRGRREPRHRRLFTRIAGGTPLALYTATHYASKRKHSMLRKVCTKPVVSASLRGKERRGTREILPADEWLPRPGPVTVAVSPPVKSLASGWTDIVRLRDEVRED